MTGFVSVGTLRTEILTLPEVHRSAFAAKRALVLPDLLDSALLAATLARCRTASFVDDHVEHLGTRRIESPHRATAALDLALGRPPLLRWLEAATGCAPLLRAGGRVVETHANGSDQLVWHDDGGSGEGRRLGITIDLTETPYAGGDFELRRKGETDLLYRHRHDRAGSALVFAIGKTLEHRLLPLTDGGPRRVYAGWFLSK